MSMTANALPPPVRHRDLDHPPPYGRQHGRHRKIDTGILRKEMIVFHDQQQQRDADDPAQRRRCQRPLVDRYPENLEHHVADRDVDQDQQQFDLPGSAPLAVFELRNAAQIFQLVHGAYRFRANPVAKSPDRARGGETPPIRYRPTSCCSSAKAVHCLLRR